jgi:hypothetical protein
MILAKRQESSSVDGKLVIVWKKHGERQICQIIFLCIGDSEGSSLAKHIGKKV